MKTEQEQIEQMITIFKNNREVCHHTSCIKCKYCDDKDCMYSSRAHSLYQAGYGDVSEYKAEIEQLKAKNKVLGDGVAKAYTNGFTDGRKQVEKDIRRAKIDVLKELKTRHDYANKNMGYPWDISQQIDELLTEVEKQ